jgi:hypothetical protein
MKAPQGAIGPKESESEKRNLPFGLFFHLLVASNL